MKDEGRMRIGEPDRLNFVPLPYRQVSVQAYGGELSEAAIIEHLGGRDSYRRTRFVILHQGRACAVTRVDRESEGPLFSPITAVEVLALPETCVWVDDAAVDTANPSALAAAALAAGADERMTVVVRGMDEHVNFIHRPRPTEIQIVDVVPPEPSKLLRMAQQVLGYADLPAIVLRASRIDLRELARQAPAAAAYLIPCRASGMDFGVPTFFLDERPARHDWTMLACERSCQIHQHFYGEVHAPRIDFCPRNLARAGEALTLVKCCLLEDRIEVIGRRAIVPWGASLGHVLAALEALVQSSGSRLPVGDEGRTTKDESSTRSGRRPSSFVLRQNRAGTSGEHN